jgi:RNA polymerase sigma factor (sigma-70 family)
MDDKELISEVLRGNTLSFRLLVERHQDMVYSIALRITGAEEEAAETAQDVFLKAFKALGSFQGDSKFSTWIYRIAFNTSVSYKRRQKPTVRFSIQAHGNAMETQPTQALEQKKWLAIAMKKLTADDAGVLTLFYMKELSLDEIAEITGMKPNAVKVKLHRARKRLGDELKKLLADEVTTLV